MKTAAYRKVTMLALICATVAPVARVAAQRGMSMPATSAGADRAMNMAEHSMSGGMDSIMMRHMELSPERVATRADSAKAFAAVKELRAAIAKYQDTVTAVADGYVLFAPGIKNQRVYHFTKRGNAFEEAFRFNAAKPTSLL